MQCEVITIVIITLFHDIYTMELKRLTMNRIDTATDISFLNISKC